MHALLDRGLLDHEDFVAERARLSFVATLQPGRWPDVSVEFLRTTAEEWLAASFIGMRTMADAARIEWKTALHARLDYRQRRQLDELAPSHLEVPTGSRVRIDYTDPAAPFIAVRIQEMFGLTRTPTVGDGAVPITLHLLSPAHRPVQVTKDLAGFWKNSYFDVRKDLKGRYPRHPWPDDPASASPTRRAKPRGQ
jgi:ATP-dependent helicase HrpB